MTPPPRPPAPLGCRSGKVPQGSRRSERPRQGAPALRQGTLAPCQGTPALSQGRLLFSGRRPLGQPCLAYPRRLRDARSL
eukprot:8807276-Pyramimonas_sp.AAC.1